jgi:hypothetical protein
MRMRRAIAVRSAFARHADQEIEPLGEIGMGQASEMPFRCGGAQDGEEAVEFEGAALFETRDFRFDLGLEFGSLISFAAGLAARDILFDLFDKSEVPREAAKRGSGGAWQVSTAAGQAAMSAASMIS